MSQMPWLLVLVAIAANIGLNLSLKILSTSTSVVAMRPLSKFIGFVLTAPSFWIAGMLGFTLIGSFMLAVRTLPLSLTYASITGGAMAGLALVGLFTGSEQLGTLKFLGLSCVILGVALMSRG